MNFPTTVPDDEPRFNRTYEVPSKSRRGLKHLVWVGAKGSGIVHCDCDGFKFHERCRHVKRMEQLLGVSFKRPSEDTAD